MIGNPGDGVGELLAGRFHFFESIEAFLQEILIILIIRILNQYFPGFFGRNLPKDVGYGATFIVRFSWVRSSRWILLRVPFSAASNTFSWSGFMSLFGELGESLRYLRIGNLGDGVGELLAGSFHFFESIEAFLKEILLPLIIRIFHQYFQGFFGRNLP